MLQEFEILSPQNSTIHKYNNINNVRDLHVCLVYTGTRHMEDLDMNGRILLKWIWTK